MFGNGLQAVYIHILTIPVMEEKTIYQAQEWHEDRLIELDVVSGMDV
jgi:hypothetical protein